MPVALQYMRSSFSRTKRMVFGLLFVLVLLVPMTLGSCADAQGRVAFWKLDEGSGGTAVDSAEDHDGNLMNGPQWLVGRFGSALSFDGENDYVLMPFSGGFDFDNRDFSLVVWVKTEDVYSQTQDTRIVNYGGSTYNQYMLLCQNDGRVCFYVDAGGGSKNVYTNAAVDDGKWHLIVAIRDNTSNRLKIYFDGEIQNTAIGGAGDLRNKEATRRFVIGRRQKGGTGQTHSYFEGVIDEIAVYNRALTDQEAKALYPKQLRLGSIGMPDGVCGPLKALSDLPVGIVFGDGDSYSAPDTIEHYEPGEYPPIAMATTHGNGRVVAISQEGFFLERNINRYDNLLLGLNSIEWLDRSGNKRVLYDDRSYPPVGTGPEEWGVYSGLGRNLVARDYLVDRFPVEEPITAAVLANYDVYMVCTSWDTFSPSEIIAIVRFVSNGGGLFLTGVGWSWVAYKGPLTEYPMNKIAAPFGIVFMDGYVLDPTDHIGDQGYPIFHTFYPLPGP